MAQRIEQRPACVDFENVLGAIDVQSEGPGHGGFCVRKVV
jgi:hypothetical protein